MLIGEYLHNLDTKGRLIMPAKFRSDLGHSFIVTRGLDGCLFGYPMESWEKVKNKLEQMPVSNKDARRFSRFFYSAATEVEVDKQGRINIPQTLIDFAKIDKACRVIGVSDRIEIWSSEAWDEFTVGMEDEFESLAEELIDFGL